MPCKSGQFSTCPGRLILRRTSYPPRWFSLRVAVSPVDFRSTYVARHYSSAIKSLPVFPGCHLAGRIPHPAPCFFGVPYLQMNMEISHFADRSILPGADSPPPNLCHYDCKSFSAFHRRWVSNHRLPKCQIVAPVRRGALLLAGRI